MTCGFPPNQKNIACHFDLTDRRPFMVGLGNALHPSRAAGCIRHVGRRRPRCRLHGQACGPMAFWMGRSATVFRRVQKRRRIHAGRTDIQRDSQSNWNKLAGFTSKCAASPYAIQINHCQEWKPYNLGRSRTQRNDYPISSKEWCRACDSSQQNESNSARHATDRLIQRHHQISGRV